MTAQNRSTLKANFEDGDKPTGDNFSDLIDSFLSLTDTTAQQVLSDVNFSGTVSAANLAIGTLSLTSVAASVATFTFVTAGGLVVNGTAVASAVVAQTVTTSGLVATGTAQLGGGAFVSGAARCNVTPVTAAGSTQGSAAALVGGPAFRVVLATAGENVGVQVPASGSGQTVTVVNETAVAVNVYPQTGGKINGGTANAAISVTASSAIMLRGATDLNWWAWRAG